MKKKLFIISIIILIFSCTNKKEIKNKEDIKKNINIEFKKEKEIKEFIFFPKSINGEGSDILTILLVNKEYLNYNIISNIYTEIDGNIDSSVVNEYYKNIKKYPNRKKDIFNLVKTEKLNDSTYFIFYKFDEFYKQSMTKKILIRFNKITGKSKIVLDKDRIKYNDMSAILRDE